MHEQTAPSPRRNLALRAGAVILLGACLAACQSNRATQWDVYQEPIKPGKLPTQRGASELSIVWRKRGGRGAEDGYALLRPALGQLGVLSASRDGVVSLRRGNDGESVWSTDLQANIFSGVAAGDGVAAVALDNGEVVALDEQTGDELWRTEMQRQISAVPAVGRGRVVVRTADGWIFGLRAGDGQREWDLERSAPALSVHGDSNPVIIDDILLVGLANGRLIAHNVITGKEYWETALGLSEGRNELERMSDADTAPLVLKDRVFTAAYQGNVASLQLRDARMVWRTKLSTRLDLSLWNNRLFVTEALGGVSALDADSGEIVWQQKSFQGRGVSHPLALSDRVVIGDGDGRLHLLASDTGELVETFDVGSGAVLSLIQAGDNQFVAFTSKGEIALVNLQIGDS